VATINGTAGNDTLSGTTGTDTINGLGGNDSLQGFDGNDSVLGGAGNDTVRGNNGTDWVEGGAGNDNVGGGSGQDSFAFHEAGSANADVFNDFSSNWDNIQLDAAFFTALGSAGRFSSGDARFWSSTSGTAHDADDRIIYNTATRQLWYDADGNGSGAAQLIGTLNTGATVVASDIWVFGAPAGGSGQTVNGTSGNDSLVGGAGNDTINGFDGEDTINGLGGADSMIGGAHSDLYFVDNAGDVIVEFENGGIDQVNASVSYTLAAWVNDLTLTGSANINGTGNDVANVITGNSGANNLSGGLDDDTLIGGDGNDTLDGGAGTNVLDGGLGDDTYTATGTIMDAGGIDTLITEGGGLPDGIENMIILDSTNPEPAAAGNALANRITSQVTGQVFIDGMEGNDTLVGGAGAERFSFHAPDYGNDTVDGGGQPGLARDWLFVGWNSAAQMTAAGFVTGGGTGGSGSITFSNIEVIQGSGFNDRLVAGSTGITLHGGGGDDTLVGGAGNDTLDGEGEFETTSPATGNDEIFGGAGNDLIGGWRGNDTLDGGAGDDTFSLHGAEGLYGTDVIHGGDGVDTVQLIAMNASAPVVVDLAAGTVTGGAEGSSATLTSIENAIVAFGNAAPYHITGSVASNVLQGGSGSDTISGGAGNDTLSGGAGPDDFVFNTAPGSANADLITDFSSGSDKIHLENTAHANLGAAGNFTAGDARFAANSSGSAQDSSDRIIYNTTTGQLLYDADGSGSGASQLIATLSGAPALLATDIAVVGEGGGSGGQTINGTPNNDSLVGTSGNDTINGFGGNDTLRGAGGGPDGADTLNGGSGNDSLVGGPLEDGADLLIGGDGNDTLDGWSHFFGEQDPLAETMDGGLGDDVYRVDNASDVLVDGGGTDTIHAADMSWTLAAGFENLVIHNGEQETGRTGIGNELDNHMTLAWRGTLEGRDGNDTLVAGPVEDVWLDGGTGDDVLEGETGQDTLIGGAGNDTMFGDDSSDLFVFEGNFGSDFVDGDIGRVDVLNFSGAGSAVTVDFGTGTASGASGSVAFVDIERAEGSAFDDVLRAGAIGVELAGGDGNDTLVGGQANDTLDGSSGSDRLEGGAGDDWLNGGTWVFPSEGPQDGADVLIGGDGNDTLSGWAGRPHDIDELVETMDGGLGDDLFMVDNANDVLIDSGGIDVVNTFGVDWTLGAGFEHLSMSFDEPEGAATGIGNELDNIISSAGGGRLEGRGGHDTLTGGAGRGTYLGGDGNDSIHGGDFNDTLDGGAGNDILDGIGAGVYAFSAAPGAANADQIINFGAGFSVISLDRAVMPALGPSGAFIAGDARFAANDIGAAQDAGDRVIYNTSNGQLWYDADGNGAAAANLIATLVGAPALAATDIEVVGSAGGQTIDGTESDDTLAGTAGDDVIDARGGNDFVTGESGADTIFGGAGNDSIYGGRHSDFLDSAGNRLFGGDGNDGIVGGTGDDYIEGNAGGDGVHGYDGSDTLVGGIDHDTYTGGRGADTFVFDVAPGIGNYDSWQDFESGVDTIELDAQVMPGLGASGTLTVNDGRFYAAFGAREGHDADDRIIYDLAQGWLYYDADGIGGAAAQLIANLSIPSGGDAYLVATDIVVVNAAPGTSGNGTQGNDSLAGTAADDTLQGFGGNDTLNGLDGNDELAGGDGSDSLVGGAGSDSLAGGSGSDTLDGGTGDDRYLGLDATDTVVDAGGRDAIVATGSFTLGSGPVEDLYLAVAAGAANGTGNAAANYLSGNSDENVLSGLDGNDTLFGADGDDTLLGGTGNDTLTGGEGSNVLDGGIGMDWLVSTFNHEDRFTFSAAPGAANADAIISFEGGIDQIVIDGSAMSAIGPSGDWNTNDVRFYAAAGATSGHDADDRLIYDTSSRQLYYDADGSGAGASQLLTFVGLFFGGQLFASDISVVNGSASGLVINGTAGNDNLDGSAGNDTINAFGGDDHVNARDGHDQVDGGEGNDRLWGGDDDGADLLIGGAGNDQLVGQAGDDTLLGGDGDDTFQGGVAASGQFGNDSLDGGAGIDTLSFAISSTFSGMTIDLGAGTLTGGGANGSGSASLSGIENVFAGGAADRITGSAVANAIDGYDGDDTIDGGAGDDTLYGNSREDMVVGGLGNDVVDGGSESDTLTGGAGADDFAFTTWPFESVDTITDFASGLDELRFDGFTFIRIGGSDFSAGDGRFHAAAGATSGHDADDRVIFNTSTGEVFYDADGAGSEAAHLVARLEAGASLVASDIGVDNGIPDQQINGTPGDDSLEGGAGFDTINGHGGNDTLIGSDGDDALDGGAGNDSVRGEAGADVLAGGDGNDTLDGLWQPSGHPEGDGEFEVDTMNGGLGDDLYRVDNPGDVLSDTGGTDTVHVLDDLDWTLGAGLENLFLFNQVTQVGIGNELHNFMRVIASGRLEGRDGNDTLIGENDEFGDDTLDGGAGVDSLDGGLGNDTYVVTAGDILVDAGGTDTVQTDVTWSLGTAFENLTMTGAGNITMQGNNLDNLIIGNAGNNTFNARAGDDTILAGGGNDRIDMFGNGFASYGNEVVDGGAGVDSMDFSGYAKTGIVVNLATGQVTGGGDAGSGTVAVSNVETVITGAFNDRFTGNSGANTFDGRGGNDTLSGGGGNDTLTGGTGNDFFLFDTAPGATNVERITDFSSAPDQLQFENAIFTAIGGTGTFAAGDGRFWAAAGATSGHDANDRVVYNVSTGSLYYDADGSGSGTAVLVATFQGNPTIAATDITVI
jgi:Ca2+-binding RTX toxin-like protein